MAERYDVAILGGGLAGLTAALQIKRARPETSVLLLEKRKGPAPLAAFKVGESTLELSAHYFANVLDLHDHLDAEHVHKPALRYFFTAGDNRDVTRRVEWGPPGSRAQRLRSFQIDRGRFENELADRCRAQGVDLRDGARVEDVDLTPGDADHTVTFTEDGDEKTASARWVVGATGRASLIRRKLGLERAVDHAINSSWLRLAGGLKIDDWSDDPDWQARMFDSIRWMCTNHLMGQGYWVWLIPLVVGRDQHRHRRRPPLPSVRAHQHARGRARLARRARAAGGRRDPIAPATTSRTSSRSSTTRTAPSACSRPTAGA